MVNETLQTGFNPDESDWEDFVYNHPKGNIFQSPCMFRLYNSVPSYDPGVISIKDQNENISGILSYNIIREPGIKEKFSARSVITGGPLAKNNDPFIISMLLIRYQKIISEKKVIYSQIRNACRVDELSDVFFRNRFKYNDHLTIYLDLTKDTNTLISEMHPKRYSNIRRMMKKDITIRALKQEDADDLYRIVTKTYNRINMPRPPAALFLNALCNLKGRVLMLGSFTNNVLIGVRIYLLYKQTIYDWYAASDLDYSNFHPNDILPWKAMIWAKENGYTLYDFAGAGEPGKPYGVRDYKMKFGGELINNGRYLCVHRPLMYQAGKTGMKLLQQLRIRI